MKIIKTLVNGTVKFTIKSGVFVKEFAKTIAKQGLKKLARTGISLGVLLVYGVTQLGLTHCMRNKFFTYLNFVEPQEWDFGYLSPSYLRDVYYTRKDNKTYTGEVLSIKSNHKENEYSTPLQYRKK